jgi:benzaldehyde dehydrogenase (NAD)
MGVNASIEAPWQGKIYYGDWIDADGGTVEVLEKATGEKLAMAGVGAPSDIAAAAELAASRQPAWGDTSFEERGAVLRRFADILEAEAEHVIEWLVRETGEIRPRATHEVRISVGEVREAVAMTSQPYGELLPSGDPGRLSIAQRVPVGVVGGITPWNAPVILGIRLFAPAIALGNAVVMKPDEQTPVTGGLLLAEMLQEAGLPEGIFNVVPGGAVTGEALVSDPNINMISFTGSTEVGRKVGRTAGELLKRVSLELGGNNALIVLDDADIESASSSGAWGSFLHQGQLCFSTGRHLVHQDVADQYAEALTTRAENLNVGDPWAGDDISIGPIINQTQLDHFVDIVDRTVSAGAEVRTGASGEGLFYQPTVLDKVTPDMAAFEEEIFGPVAPITVFSDEDEAIDLAARSEYGLTASIYTRDIGRGLRIARQMRTGMVHINDTTINDQAAAPFGGMGASGNGGRFGTLANWEEFTQWQWCTTRERGPIFQF